MKPDNAENDKQDHLADIVRQKIENIHQEEPDANLEESEVKNVKTPSKHQKYMQELMNSGLNDEQLQAKWHTYYMSLSEDEKKNVWDEFYESNYLNSAFSRNTNLEKELTKIKHQVVTSKRFDAHQKSSTPKKQERKIDHKAKAVTKAKLKPKHYFQSLLFGLSMGSIVLIIFLFGFFNEIIIAPLIQPGRNTTPTPVIIGDGNITATSVDEVIIPKINVEIPVNYSVKTTNEKVIENGLESGVVHYPNTVLPGEIGNAAYFGHSSNNIFNPGKYKFAFVLLHTLVKGDTFYLTYSSKVYVYKVISTNVVDPSDVSVLKTVDNQVATATLITCDPPGTSLHRLVVVGTQISPDVSTNTAPAENTNNISSPKTLADNGPTLWHRFIGSIVGKSILLTGCIVIAMLIIRRSNKQINY